MRRRTLSGILAGGLATGLVVIASAVWPGLDAKETPPVDTAVWAVQSGEGRQYSRVNTAVRELDIVRGVSNPSAVVQSSHGVFLYSDSYSKITRIDPAEPVDLDEEVLRSSGSTPSGTIQVATAGDYVAYRTDAGAVYAGPLSDEGAVLVDPFASDEGLQYAADTVAINEEGLLFAYSATDGAVLTYDTAEGEVVARDDLVADVASPLITAAGATWAVVNAESGLVWIKDAEGPVNAGTVGTPSVAEPALDGVDVYLADETGLVAISTEDGAARTIVGDRTTVLGFPAPPILHDGVTLAAWVPAGAAGGTLWSSEAGETTLDFGGLSLAEQRRPLFVESADAVILNETRSGWVWTAPDGVLVSSSQDWSLDDVTQPDSMDTDEPVTAVTDPRPPVAEPDSFGVRAGQSAVLPVLLNDHDPNEDVLTIRPDSVTALDPEFGVVSLTDDDQRFTVRLADGASGSASFSYAVSDGTTSDGLVSDVATVTLNVVGDAQSAPEWCGVESCLAQWPTPEVARGGTVSVPVLAGWVDPEGDPVFVAAVENVTGTGSVAATPAGEIVYQHDDDGAGSEELVTLSVTVSDTHGAVGTRPLTVRVSPEPALAVESFAVTEASDSSLTIDVAAHVTGTAGTLSLESVRVLDDAPATATVVGGSTTFDFAAQEPGTFRVGFTVTDGTSEATGTARVIILPADAPANLSTPPIMAFVHPQQDVTLDVFSAVGNPTNRVLLLGDIETTAEEDASLSVDVVGQEHLRVSGSTANGEAGLLGRIAYTVSDGSNEDGASVRGEATVYLLPPAPEVAPIAVDDMLVVRAGDQIDIPVLENDVAPAGGRPTLHPDSIISSSEGALAFASGDVVRYLAAEEPGDYRVDYTISTTGSPSLTDVASVHIRVVSHDVNRAPAPVRLDGRVLSGQSTVIDFDGLGMDPDGDVVQLDRVVSQPDSGVASISPEGDSIVYTSVAGDSGQVEFQYSVVDSFGEHGEGTVRVGILDAQANPGPITFTDYVQVQQGSANSLTIEPLSNDVDPTLGDLTITDVRPDAAENLADGTANPEYERLDGLIERVEDDLVEIGAGTTATTMAYLYDVESTSGNTGRGRIVVRVVRESVPNYPRVSDTILTAEDRDDFTAGVDVLTDKVSWTAGSVADLEVGLWGSPEDVEVSGSRLRGPLPEQRRVIPFSVTDTADDGEDIQTYAFLRVPGENDVAPFLRAENAPITVDELASVTFDLADLVALPPGRALEVGPDVHASGAREAAACRSVGGTDIRYDAGVGAPWADACQIPVRVSGASEWTYLSVPLVIEALEPQPELRSAGLTISPGETVSYDLNDLTTWRSRTDWEAIRYAVSGSSEAFRVLQEGSLLTITGADTAPPGLEESVPIEVTSHSGVTPARLVLRVGAVPSTLPQGGTVEQVCAQDEGSSCTVDVVGAPGEVNPLPGTPLRVVASRSTGECAGVSFTPDGDAVRVSWTADTQAATCTASFTVEDAQGRRSAGDRDGRLIVDLQGLPLAPASITQVEYDDEALTLRVDPGQATRSYPALEGFDVSWEGQVVARCDAQGVCPAITAPNGEQRGYTAVAVSDTGVSRESVQTTAWAYRPPASPEEVTVSPAVTSGAGGLVDIHVDGIETSQTGSLTITAPGAEPREVAVGHTSLVIEDFAVGGNSATPITVTPYSTFEVPAGLPGSPSGSGVTVLGNGVGAPTGASIVLDAESTGGGRTSITARASAGINGDGSTLRYGIVLGQDPASCVVSDGGSTASFTGLRDGEVYAFTMCVESWYDGDSYGRASATEWIRADQSEQPPRGWVFRVDSVPEVSDGAAAWTINDRPSSSETPPNRNRVEIQGWPTDTFGQDPRIRVRYVHEDWDTATPWATAQPASGSAPYQLSARWWVDSCVGLETLSRRSEATQVSSASARVTFDDAALTFLGVDGDELDYEPGSWIVPEGAVRAEGIGVRVAWGAWGLQDATDTFGVDCDPNLQPAAEVGEPEPIEPGPGEGVAPERPRDPGDERGPGEEEEG